MFHRKHGGHNTGGVTHKIISIFRNSWCLLAETNDWGVPRCSGVFRGVPGCSEVFRALPECSEVFRVLVHATRSRVIKSRLRVTKSRSRVINSRSKISRCPLWATVHLASRPHFNCPKLVCAPKHWLWVGIAQLKSNLNAFGPLLRPEPCRCQRVGRPIRSISVRAHKLWTPLFAAPTAERWSRPEWLARRWRGSGCELCEFDRKSAFN